MSSLSNSHFEPDRTGSFGRRFEYNRSQRASRISRFPLDRVFEARDAAEVAPDAQSDNEFYVTSQHQWAVMEDLVGVIGIDACNRKDAIWENIQTKDHFRLKFGDQQSDISVIQHIKALNYPVETVLVAYANGRAAQFRKEHDNSHWSQEKGYDLEIEGVTASYQLKGLVVFSRWGSDRVSIVNFVDKEMVCTRLRTRIMYANSI